jgi:hypothetical protein
MRIHIFLVEVILRVVVNCLVLMHFLFIGKRVHIMCVSIVMIYAKG